MRNKVLRFVIM